MIVALTRSVSASLAQCELTHLSREVIDVERARVQHAVYERKLQTLRVHVRRVAGADEMPDGVFIEDTAVVVGEVAVMTRPGAESRRAEVAGVAAVLSDYRPLRYIEAPGTLDGGDVMVVGKRVWVGLSSRTNLAGAEGLRAVLKPFGYAVETVRLEGCLHLKSAVTALGREVLLVNPAWLPGGGADVFAKFDRVEVDPSEPYAANALRVRETLIFPEHFPRTLERLEKWRFKVVTVPCDELAKAEGAVTCCSILLDN